MLVPITSRPHLPSFTSPFSCPFPIQMAQCLTCFQKVPGDQKGRAGEYNSTTSRIKTKSCINKEQPRWETLPSDRGAEERRKRQKERTVCLVQRWSLRNQLLERRPAPVTFHGQDPSMLTSPCLGWIGLGWGSKLMLGFRVPLLLPICSGAKALDKPGGKACSTPFGDEEGKVAWVA